MLLGCYGPLKIFSVLLGCYGPLNLRFCFGTKALYIWFVQENMTVQNALFAFCPGKICQSTSGSGVQHNTLLLCFSLVTTEISLKRTAQGNVHLNWSYHIEKLTLCCVLGVEGSVTAEAENCWADVWVRACVLFTLLCFGWQLWQWGLVSPSPLTTSAGPRLSIWAPHVFLLISGATSM